MAHDSRFERYEIFTATAVVGAHANNPTAGFRHKDVKFLIELFSNWLMTSHLEPVLSVQNTQVARYLKDLVDEGYARKVTRSTYPQYRLSRTGLIELVSRLVSREYFPDRDHFFFLYYFIKNYRPRLEELVKAEGKQFPIALKLELDTLLDVKALVARELAAAERELKKLEVRIEDAKNTSALVTRLTKDEYSFSAIVQEAQRLYPYELNTQKPLTELISELPPEMQRWEMEYGNMHRAREMWGPSQALLVAYIHELRKLQRVV